MSETTLDANAIATAANNRTRAILASEVGQTMPTLAAFLSYETTMEADVATKALAAAQVDLLKAANRSGAVTDPVAAAAAYAAQKQEAGALGLGRPGATSAEKPDAVAMWGKAVASVNRTLGVE